MHFRTAPKSRYLNHFCTVHHMNNLETPADDAAAAEKFVHLFRSSIGRHIKIFRLDTEQQIPDRPPDNISLEACLLQTAYDFLSGKTQHFGTDVVPFQRYDRFTFRSFATASGRKYFIQPFFQHKHSDPEGSVPSGNRFQTASNSNNAGYRKNTHKRRRNYAVRFTALYMRKCVIIADCLSKKSDPAVTGRV